MHKDVSMQEMTVTSSINGGYHLYFDGKPIATIHPHYQAPGVRIYTVVQRIKFLWNNSRGAKSQNFVTNPATVE